MKPRDFPESNAILRGGPADKYGTDADVGDLPTWTDGRGRVSCWRPTLRERISILLFGRVWVRFASFNHPPVAIVGSREFFIEETSE